MILKNKCLAACLNDCLEEIVVFGTSFVAMAMMEEVYQLDKCGKITYFVDNNSNMWGKKIQIKEFQYDILPPKSLLNEKKEIAIIIASTYVYDIALQLQQYQNLKNTKCFFYTFMEWKPDYDLTGYFERTNQLREKCLHQETNFKALKGSHERERCFILGNGPSLVPSDLELIKHEFSFGANQIFLMFEKTDWRPSAYLTVNVDTILTYGSEIDRLDCKYKFIDSKALDYDVVIKDALYLKHGDYKESDEIFSDDISSYYYNGGTVVYTAIQTAVYMGFKKIYLLGVDHSYKLKKDSNGTKLDNSVANHFYKYDDDKKKIDLYNTVDLDYITGSFQHAQEYAARNKIQILNATRGGNLEVFPRVNLEDVINH